LHQDGRRADDQRRLLQNGLIIPSAVSAWTEPPALSDSFEESMLISARRR
jgi:hypothetical protein